MAQFQPKGEHARTFELTSQQHPIYEYDDTYIIVYHDGYWYPIYMPEGTRTQPYGYLLRQYIHGAVRDVRSIHLYRTVDKLRRIVEKKDVNVRWVTGGFRKVALLPESRMYLNYQRRRRYIVDRGRYSSF